MYCIKCGVKLEDTEKKCPLCGTVVYHPELTRAPAESLYPAQKMPQYGSEKRAVSGILLLLFLIPMLLSCVSDLQPDGKLDWFGYVAGALTVTYMIVFLPLWFQKPNPVVFLGIDFAAVALFLAYIDWQTQGGWFWGFGLPVTLGVAAVICTMVALLHYLRRGRLFVYGGTIMGFGVLVMAIEWLLSCTFSIAFVGWSFYPMVVVCLLGGFLIYLAIHRSAREALQRKLFF